MKLAIVWKRGFDSFYKGASAQKVYDEIQSIGESATPQQILDKARDENTELHKCFEWDDSVAAERWRLHQARQVVCHIVFNNEKDEQKTTPQLRCFFNNDKKSGEGYKPTKVIIEKEDEYKKLLNTAMGELYAFKIKYKILSELEEIFDDIDKLFT